MCKPNINHVGEKSINLIIIFIVKYLHCTPLNDCSCHAPAFCYPHVMQHDFCEALLVSACVSNAMKSKHTDDFEWIQFSDMSLICADTKFCGTIDDDII